jgi:hypothetical protein
MESNSDITKLGILNYKFNEHNKKLFLENTAEDVRNIMERFLDITIHISYESFIKKIKDNLIQVLKNNYESHNKIFVYINYYEINKSNYWIYRYIEYFLKDLKISVKIIDTLDEEEVKNNDIILFTDDCIYSGLQMSGVIYNIKNTNNKEVKIILFVPYISKYGLNNIKKSYNENTSLNKCKFIISDHEIIKPLKHFLSEDDINKLFYYYNEHYDRASKRYAIYFDHKLGDTLSTFPKIYNGLVPNKNNLDIIKKIDNRKQIIYFPLFTNCENNKTFIIECPYPPYKEDYNTNLQNNNLLSKTFYYLKENPIKIEEISTTNIFTNIETLKILIEEHFKKVETLYKFIKE